MSVRIAVVDYGAGNLTSVVKGLSAAGGAVHVAASPTDVRDAAGIVIPGVGHFGATAALGGEWRRALTDHLSEGRPLLGICLGMQWLFEGSDEAPGLDGFGLLRGRCTRLDGGVKVPHVGWNTLAPAAPSRLLAGVAPGTWAYFTHAYAIPATAEGVAASATHGWRFAAAVERGAVFGTQYHPEKSGVEGIRQLGNFIAAARG